MALFETVVLLLVLAALLSQLARWVRTPYPTMLAVIGAAVAAYPGAPRLIIQPQLALVLFVAPAVLSIAYDTSPYELKRNWLPLLCLAVFAVVLTAAAVAFAGWMFAGLPLAAAIALGAIVAPPDTVAASAVLSNLGIPRRTMTILQGESLLNDAVALLIFGGALATAMGTGGAWTVLPRLALAVPGGIVLGLVLGFGYVRLWPIWAGTLSATILEFVSVFGVWLLAERLAVSPVLALVSYGMLVAQFGPVRQRPRDRIHAFSVWDCTVFVLNVLAFLLMGLQARIIVERLSGDALSHAMAVASMVFGIVVVVRVVWVLIFLHALRYFHAKGGKLKRRAVINRMGLLVGWCGMRGILTLATAFALPAGFPSRDVIVLSAFGVVLGTLIIQGMTIAPLIRWLRIPVDDSLQQDILQTRRLLARAGLARLDSAADQPSRALDSMRLALTSRASQDALDEVVYADALFKEVVAAQRRALIDLHRRGQIPEDAFRILQQELDWRELSVAPMTAREIAEA